MKVVIEYDVAGNEWWAPMASAGYVQDCDIITDIIHNGNYTARFVE